MSLDIDQANQVINDQEDAIADLREKLLEMTDERDLAIGKSLELVAVLKRIECLDTGRSADLAIGIARKAIDAYQAK